MQIAQNWLIWRNGHFCLTEIAKSHFSAGCQKGLDGLAEISETAFWPVWGVAKMSQPRHFRLGCGKNATFLGRKIDKNERKFRQMPKKRVDMVGSDMLD